MGVVEGLQLKSSNLLTGPLTFLRKRNDKLLFLLFPGLIKYDQCKKQASQNISTQAVLLNNMQQRYL